MDSQIFILRGEKVYTLTYNGAVRSRIWFSTTLSLALIENIRSAPME